MAALVQIGCCLTDYLLNELTSFSKQSFKNKKYIIKHGRARPDIKIDYRRNDLLNVMGFSNIFTVLYMINTIG